MDSVSQPTSLDPAIRHILSRAERTVASAGERLLVERLHRTLDQGGIAGLSTFSDALLPQLQALVALLPHLLHDDAPDATDVVRSLGISLQERGVGLHAVVDEGMHVHSALLHEVASHLREDDRALVAAVGQLSRALLKVAQGTLLAYYDNATSTLAQLAHSDSLTGLSNRRYFDTRLHEEILRAQRGSHTLALILLDVDGLKRVNDTYGHSAGDTLLRSMAAMLQEQTRAIDVAARIGGDEFALLLPETDRDGAVALLDRLSQGIAATADPARNLRFSAGVAMYPVDAADMSDLFDRADSALYQVKRSKQP